MLTIKALNKTYANGVQALKDIHLEIPTGLYGLLGPNGAGKSSLMRTIATLQEPDSGSIHFDGIDVLQDKEALTRLKAAGWDFYTFIGGGARFMCSWATREAAVDHLAADIERALGT